MSKKKIKRPQQYRKPKDPTFKEWWSQQNEKTQKNLKIAAVAVAAVIVLALVFYYGIYDDGSLKIRNDAVVGKEDNWLIAELDGGKNSDYYHVANVATPEGYVVSAESAAGTVVSGSVSHDNDFTFNPADESLPVDSVYVRAVNKTVNEMIDSVYATFESFVGETGVIGEVTTIDTQFGEGKSFVYQYSYENEEEAGKLEYSQSQVNYVPTQFDGVSLLIAVNVYPESEEGYTDEATLSAARDLVLAGVEMLEK